MARVRPSAVATGQLHHELRNRDTSGFQTSHLAALAALIDDIGEPVWACGPTAAALHRLDGFRLMPPFHVVIPRGRNVRRIGHVIHTSERLDPIDRETVLGLPVMAPPRTLIDLSATSSPSALTVALDAALRDRLATESFLHERIHDLRTTGRYGIPKLLSVIEGCEITRGTHSWLERQYLQLLHDAGLPRPRPQQVLGRRGTTLIRVDFLFPGTPVVVEVLGYRWHRTTAQMGIDAQRLNQLLLDGKHPLQFTYDQVVGSPDYVVDATRSALHLHRGPARSKLV